jgi:prepilin-type processing-associated H-X9-DG protein
MGTATLMYANDYDDTVLPYLECRASCGNLIPQEQRTWTYKMQPYVKNGGGWPANGLFADPSWSMDAVLKGADEADCDGTTSTPNLHTDPPAQLNGKTAIFADYGIAFAMCPSSQSTDATPCTSPADYGMTGETVADALFLYPGSLNYPASQGGLTRSLSDVARPSETAIISDGVTYLGSSYWWITFGCESAHMHNEGGNYTFLDGHAKGLRGNAERYRIQKSDGLWIEKYFYYAE